MGLKIDGIVRFDKKMYLSYLKREPLKADVALIDLKEILKKLNLINI